MANRRLILKERITAIIGSGLLFALVALSYYYSVKVENEGLKYVPSESSPDFTAGNITLTDFSEDGSPKVRLAASSVAHFSDERMRAEDASLFSIEPGKPEIVASAEEAWSNDGMETIELSGNVSVFREATKNEPELEFKTEYIRGQLDTYTFETNHEVFMKRGLDSTKALNGMIYNNVDRTIELNGSVHTTLNPVSRRNNPQ